MRRLARIRNSGIIESSGNPLQNCSARSPSSGLGATTRCIAVPDNQTNGYFGLAPVVRAVSSSDSLVALSRRSCWEIRIPTQSLLLARAEAHTNLGYGRVEDFANLRPRDLK